MTNTRTVGTFTHLEDDMEELEPKAGEATPLTTKPIHPPTPPDSYAEAQRRFDADMAEHARRHYPALEPATPDLPDADPLP